MDQDGPPGGAVDASNCIPRAGPAVSVSERRASSSRGTLRASRSSESARLGPTLTGRGAQMCDFSQEKTDSVGRKLLIRLKNRAYGELYASKAATKKALPFRRPRVLHTLWHCHGVRLYADRLRGSFGIPCVFLGAVPCTVLTIITGILYPHGFVFMLEVQ